MPGKIIDVWLKEEIPPLGSWIHTKKEFISFFVAQFPNYLRSLILIQIVPKEGTLKTAIKFTSTVFIILQLPFLVRSTLLLFSIAHQIKFHLHLLRAAFHTQCYYKLPV